MNIESLLDGEKITLCNHHQGHIIAIDDNGLHLDKRFNYDNIKNGKANVRITLQDGISVLDKRGANADDIIKELKEAFRDIDLRKAFLESTKVALTNLATNGADIINLPNSNILRNKVDKILIGIVKFFGVDENEVSEILYNDHKCVVSRWEYTKKRDGIRSTLYTEIDVETNSISLSRNKKMLRGKRHTKVRR